MSTVIKCEGYEIVETQNPNLVEVRVKLTEQDIPHADILVRYIKLTKELCGMQVYDARITHMCETSTPTTTLVVRVDRYNGIETAECIRHLLSEMRLHETIKKIKSTVDAHYSDVDSDTLLDDEVYVIDYLL